MSPLFVERSAIEAMVVVTAGMFLLSIWAGMSRLHWFGRAAVLLLAISLFLPIRAYEVVLLFLFVLPTVSLCLVAIRTWSPEIEITTTNASLARGWSNWKTLGCAFVAGVVVTVGAAEFLGRFLFTWYEHWLRVCFALPLTVVFVFAARDLRCGGKPVATTRPVPAAKRAFRFNLRNLLLGMTVAAAVSAMLGAVFQATLRIDWRWLLPAALCFVGISVFVAGAVVFVRSRRLMGLIALVLLAGTVALHVAVFGDWFVLGGVVHVASTREAIFLIAICDSLAASIVIAMLTLGRVMGAMSFAAKEKRMLVFTQRLAAVALIVILFGCYAPLLPLYWHMLGETDPPEVLLPQTNAYPQVMADVRETVRLNPTESGIADLKESGQTRVADELEVIYVRLMAALEKPGYVPLEPQQDPRQDWFTFQLPDIQAVRSIARSWRREGEIAAEAGRFNEASDFSLAIVRLGSRVSIGGTVVHSLLGIAVEGIGAAHIGDLRENLSPDQLRKLMRILETIDQERESLENSVQRDNYWEEHTYTWRFRLSKYAVLALTEMGPERHEQLVLPSGMNRAYFDAFRRRDVFHRLLLTDLAIRLYRAEQQTLPEDLQDLVPKYLIQVPIDPYSDRPFIYRPEGEGYTLYSVGYDGVDDGGRFGGSITLFESGFDFDLEIYNR